MADNSSSGNSKGKKKTANWEQMWENFEMEIRTTLSDINTDLTQTVTKDKTDMGSFIKGEATLATSAADFGGPPPYTKSPDWKEILSTTISKGSKSIHFYLIIYDVLKEKTLSEDEQAIQNVDLLTTIHDAFPGFL